MLEATARAQLESMVAASSAPVLTEAEVTSLLELARRRDIDGLLYTDTGWTGTYDLNAAAAEGWRWKAGKVATDFTFASDGQTFNRGEMVRACMDMADRYANRATGSIPLNLPSDADDTDIAGNVNV